MTNNESRARFRLTCTAFGCVAGLAVALFPVAGRMFLPSTVQTKPFGPWLPLSQVDGAPQVGRAILKGKLPKGKQTLKLHDRVVDVDYRGANPLTGCHYAGVKPSAHEEWQQYSVCQDFLKKPYQQPRL